MPLLNVTKEEWKEAVAFFEKNPTEIKYQKNKTLMGQNEHKEKTYAHSFVNILGVIYALNNIHHVTPEPDSGLGSFGRVKIAINQKGETFVIKITGIEHTKPFTPVDKLMQKWGYLLGRAYRKVKEQEKGIIKALIPYKTTEKVLTVFTYLGNRDLFTETTQVLSIAKKLMLGLNAMMSIEALHRHRILHRDIKAENFVLKREDAYLEVRPIDFDFAEKLLPGQNFIQNFNQRKGTKEYLSPEAFQLGRYSFASEVYALGIVLKEMDLPNRLWKPMLTRRWKERITLPNAMKAMAAYIQFCLEEDPHNEMLKKVLADYHFFKNSNYSVLAAAKTEEAADQVAFAKKLGKAALFDYVKNVIKAVVMLEQEKPQGADPLTLFKEKGKHYFYIVVIQLLLEKHGFPSTADIENIAWQMNFITQSYLHFKNSGLAKQEADRQAENENFTNLLDKENYILNKEKAILDLKLHDLSKDMKEEIFSAFQYAMAPIISVFDPIAELLSDDLRQQQDYMAMMVSTFCLIPLAVHPKIRQYDEEKLFLRLFSTHHAKNAAAYENKKLFESLYHPSCTLPNTNDRKQIKKPLIFRKIRSKKSAFPPISPKPRSSTYQPFHRAPFQNPLRDENIHNLEQSFTQIELMPLNLNEEGYFGGFTPESSNSLKFYSPKF